MKDFINNLIQYKNDKIIILGHDNIDVDSIISGYLLDKLLKKLGYICEFIILDKVINEETLNICLKYGLNPNKYIIDIDINSDYKYILVDHHDRNIDNIIGIIDHHKIVDKIHCNNCFIYEYSSTTCMICKGLEEYFSKDDLRLCFIGAFVDTVSFNSLKGRTEELDWIKFWCSKLNIDYVELYNDGLCITDISDINKIYLNGHKVHIYEDYKIESSYIQIENSDLKINVINNIIDLLKKYYINNYLDYFIFIVHDMTIFKSKVYIINDNNIEIINYDYYAPRGNVIIPDFINSI